MMMNERARAMGATNSDFRNPHGLPNPDHVSSARDLAHILRYALGVPGFRGIAATPSTDIPVVGTSKSIRMIQVRSHNRLLGSYVVPVIGKTGYTRAAGRCFAAAATLDGREVIIVVLGSSNLWGDSRKLISYGLNVLAPDAAGKLQFATADPPARKRTAVRSAKTNSSKSSKKAAVAKSKRKPSKATASSKRSSSRVEKRAVPAKVSASKKASSSSGRRSGSSRGCTGSGC
jgi:D-alanyl-D-alanine carboxypeptidase